MTILALRPTKSQCPAWHANCETIRDRDGSSHLHHGTPATIKTRHDEVTVSYSRLDTPRGSGGPTAEICVAGIPSYLDAAGLRQLISAATVVLGQVDPNDSPTVNAGWAGHNAAQQCQPGQTAPADVLAQITAMTAWLSAFIGQLDADRPAMSEVTGRDELETAIHALHNAAAALAQHGPYTHVPEEL